MVIATVCAWAVLGLLVCVILVRAQVDAHRRLRQERGTFAAELACVMETVEAARRDRVLVAEARARVEDSHRRHEI